MRTMIGAMEPDEPRRLPMPTVGSTTTSTSQWSAFSTNTATVTLTLVVADQSRTTPDRPA